MAVRAVGTGCPVQTPVIAEGVLVGRADKGYDEISDGVQKLAVDHQFGLARLGKIY
jgi:hypothetical protein